MIITIGLLHSANRFIDLLFDRVLSIPEIYIKETIFVSPLKDLINLSLQLCWAELVDKSNYSLTKRGIEIHNCTSYEERLRFQLKDLITYFKPPWSKAILNGRKEFFNYVPRDISQCFEEADLFQKEPIDHIIDWWDELSIITRSNKSAALLKIGRFGEKITVIYEKNRTGLNPKWQSIESNYSGFDILSVNSANDLTPLQIEVKSTQMKMKEAKIYITSNEWEQAESALSFKFYVWVINGPKQLAILSIEDIRKNIPTNLGVGKWETFSIPVIAYREKFIQVKNQFN